MIFLFIVDYITTVIAGLLAIQARNLVLLPFGGIMTLHFPYLLLLPIPVLCFMYSYGIYNSSMHFWNVIEKIFKSCALSFIFLLILQYFRSNSYVISRLFLAFFVLLTFMLLIITRFIFKKHFRKSGLLRNKTLLVGYGETEEATFSSSDEEDFFGGVQIIGLLSDKYANTAKIGKANVLGKYSDIESVAKKYNPDNIMIFAQSIKGETLSQLIYKAQMLAPSVSVVPYIPGLPVGNISTENMYDEKAIILNINNNLTKKPYRILKFLMDWVLSFFGVICLSPLFLFIAIWIYRDSPGSIFFKHNRVGYKGKPFGCMKFRSMCVDADKKLAALLESSPEARAEWEKDFKLKNDPRITKSGAFLRKTSLDELPQLFNVLKGEMSLVGPRPIVTKEIERYREYIADYYLVRPGVTGLWQVSGRNDVDYEERIEMDSWYVRNWSVWIDIVLLFRTVKVVLKGKGAY